MNLRPWYLCALAAIVLSLAAALILPLTRGEFPIRLGADLAGGVVVTYRPDFSTLLEDHRELDRQEVLAQARDNLSNRLQRVLHVLPDVVIRGDGLLQVTLPAGDDYRSALDLVGKTHRLTLRLVTAESRFTGEAAADEDGFRYGDRLLELAPPRFSGDMLDPASVGVEIGEAASFRPADLAPKVSFRFQTPHAAAFEAFTGEHAGRELAILLDDRVEWVGVIEGAIRGSAVLAGTYTHDQATSIAEMLRAGTLPVSLEVAGLYAVSPALGHVLQERGRLAIGLALAGLAALLGVAYRFRWSFLAASLISLGSLLVLLAGLAAAMGAVLDVVGIAGIVLSVGMGMDACILVLESLDARLRDTRPPPTPARRSALARAISSFAGEGRTLFHANATTLLVVVLLLGSERLASFATFMLLGLVASWLTILIVRETLPTLLARDGHCGFDALAWLRRPRFGLFRRRRACAVLVVTALLLGLGASATGLAGRTVIAGSDFRPGTQLVVTTPDPGALQAATEAMRGRLPDADVKHQAIGPPADGRYLLTVDTALADRLGEPADTARPTAAELLRVLSPTGVEVEGIESVDGRMSASRLLRSMTVLGGSFALVTTYLVFAQPALDRLLSAPAGPREDRATRTRIAAGVVLAVIVDMAVMLATVIWLEIPVTLAVVAGMLTIVGYSVNDSVVVWNHIQRHQPTSDTTGAATRESRINAAIDEITSRTFLTSLSTLVPALTILAAGLTPLAGFASVILTGTLSGTLTSIFIVGSFAHTADEPLTAL